MRVAWAVLLAGCMAIVDEPPADAGDAGLVDAGGLLIPDAGSTLDAGFDAGQVVTPDAGLPTVQVSGRRLVINGVPVELRAVGWNPVPKGKTQVDFAAAVERDATMMQAAGFNTVRTYAPITDRAVLDVLQRHQLWVLDTVYSYGGSPASVAVDRVRAVLGHPAVIGWLIGNEWNYNGLYAGLSFDASLARLNEVMTQIRTVDHRLPLINVYGEVPSVEVINAMPLTDVWAINAYRGKSFGDLFTVLAARTTKPMMLGEYGADAWNALLPGEDQASQAVATEALTREIHAQWSGAGGVAIGGSIFEWCDEWWKDGAGSLSAHDVGGIAPGGGPYPDATFNEEWWGLVDLDRTPRSALGVVKRAWGL